MTGSKVLNWIKWFVGALIVGGLGNGVWEKFLSPFISYLSNSTISMLVDLSTKFSDNIYSKAVTNLIDKTNSELNGLGVIFNIIIYIIIILLGFSLSKIKNIDLNINYYKSITFLFSAVSVMIFIISSRESYIHDIAKHSHKNLEIIRPYIGEPKYFQLRSNYLRITTKKEFDIYEDEVSKYSKEHSLNLKKFSD